MCSERLSPNAMSFSQSVVWRVRGHGGLRIRGTFGGSGRVLKRSSIMAEITELHLKLGGQHDCESPGREWFMTSIEEVCEILRSLDPGLTLSTLPQTMHNAATSAQCCE
jgi:hypothetical protein